MKLDQYSVIHYLGKNTKSDNQTPNVVSQLVQIVTQTPTVSHIQTRRVWLPPGGP